MNNYTSKSSNITQYANFYYYHNKTLKKIHTSTDLPNVLVSFNVGKKNIFTKLHSLFNVIKYLKNHEEKNISYINTLMFQDIEKNNIKILKIDDIKIFLMKK